jgi:hypothetical protein
MRKRIGITILIMVAVIMGGFAYANIPQTGSQQNTPVSIPDGATGVTFHNNGNSWVHAVIVFEDVPKNDGTRGNIYSDLWLQPRTNGNPGTASIDLSKLAGYGDKPLPRGTKIRMKTWANLFGSKTNRTDNLNLETEGSTTSNSNPSTSTIEHPNMAVLPLPQGIASNRLFTTLDPTIGGNYLSSLMSNAANADPSIIVPGAAITWTDATSLTIDVPGVHIGWIRGVITCINIAGGPSIVTSG